MNGTELTTLNDTRKENLELKQSCQDLRDRVDNLLNENQNLRSLISGRTKRKDQVTN